jgi:hypothetical protein
VIRLYHYTRAEGYEAPTRQGAELCASGVPQGRAGQPTDLDGRALEPSQSLSGLVGLAGSSVGFLTLLITFPSPEGRLTG